MPVEAAMAMSIVECYHAPLRRKFQIIKHETFDTNDTCALQMAVKSVNDSIGPHGYVPSLLVYGALLRLGLATDQPHTSIYKRPTAIRKAAVKLSKRFARQKIQTSLRALNGPNIKEIHETCLGQPVLVYRVATLKWTEPYKLLRIQSENVTVQLTNNKAVFRSTHVKPYKSRDISPSTSKQNN